MKRRPKNRLRFSLRALFVVFTLLGIAGGFWLSMVEPIRQQWIAVEPILDLGGRVDTQPSSIPRWMKGLLPKGKTENIDAVFFQYNPATDDAIKALERLPHLRRLYLEKSQLKSHHFDSIAKLSKLERLSIWDNSGLKNEDITRLGPLQNLNIIDMHACNNLDWRVLLAFRDNQKIKIKHTLIFSISSDVQPSEYKDLKSISRFCKPFSSGTLDNPSPQDLEQLRTWFPEVPSVWVAINDDVAPEFFDKYLELSQKKFFDLTLWCRHRDRSPVSRRRTRAALTAAWSKFGPECSELEIETNSGSDATNMLTLRRVNRSDPEFDLTIYIAEKDLESDENIFKHFPTLPNVRSLSYLRYDAALLPAMKPLFLKLPNVENVKVTSVSNFENHKNFWGALAQLEKIKQLSISFTSQLNTKEIGEAFADSKTRDSLTRLEFRSSYGYAIDEKVLEETFPNLASFICEGEERIRSASQKNDNDK